MALTAGFDPSLLFLIAILWLSLSPIPTVLSKYEFVSEFPQIALSPNVGHASERDELGIFNAFKEELENTGTRPGQDDVDSSELPALASNQSEVELFTILKDELQQLRMELTKSFVEQHTRRKRETSHTSSSFSIKVTIDKQVKGTEEQFKGRIENVGHCTTVFKSSTIVFQRDGIHRLERSSASSPPQLVKVGSWKLKNDDKILHSFEWEDKLFIVTANERGSYSQIYTMHVNSGALEFPISTQRIRNQGHATSARYFTHGNGLFMVLTVDNVARSLTISPVFRWVHTYMDQIHEIQTRGAAACETFTIGQFKYLAIAQTEDADGNTEVGTILVRMHANGEVEKFQLLWSKAPVALKYIPFLKEHFLIVGQPTESLVYWFGGFDFLQWQALEGLSGENLHIDGFVWQGEPILLAATEKQVAIYTRSVGTGVGSFSSAASSASSKLVRTSTIFTAKSSERILGAKLLQTSKTAVPLLALTLGTSSLSSSGSSTLEIVPLEITSEEIPESQIKETGDKLSQCMVSLESLLIRDEPALTLFEAEGAHILRKHEQQTFAGKITSQGQVTINDLEGKSHLGSILVKPEFDETEDAYQHSPSKVLALIGQQEEQLNGNIKRKLENVVLKSEEGEITGELTFKKHLKINTLNSQSNLNLRTLNGVEWPTLENKVLRLNGSRAQIVTGKWDIEDLNAESVDTTRKTSQQAFLLRACSKGETQIIQGDVEFQKDISVENLQIAELATINGIKFSDIALRSVHSSIEGHKKADKIHGGEGVEIDRLNDIKLSDWYASVLKTDSTEEQHVDGKWTFTNEVSMEKVKAELLNGKNWDKFLESVLLDIGNQTVHSDLSFKNLKIAHLDTDTINDKELSSILSSSTDQHITSKFHVENLKIRKNLNDDTSFASGYKINGIDIKDALLSTEASTILGPVELKNVEVDEIQTSSGVTIDGLDVEEAAKLRKKHVYFTDNPEDMIELRGDNVKATNLYATSLNRIPFDSISDMYWSKTRTNEILGDFDLSQASSVVVEREFSTATLNGLNLETDVIRIDKDEVIESTAELEFIKSTTAQGEVVMPDGVTLNDIDFSELNRQIIRVTDTHRKVTGKKTFEDDVDLENGITVHKINGISLENDVVHLKKVGTFSITQLQQVQGLKTFEEVVMNGVTTANSDVVVDGTVNGHDLVEVGKNSVYKDASGQSVTKKATEIHSDLIFEKLLTVGDLSAEEINGLKVNEILSQSINLNEPQNLDLSLVMEDNGTTLDFSGRSKILQINNILLHEYLPKIVSKNDEDVEISGTKEFRDGVHVTGDLVCDTVNGYNLKDIEEFSVSKTKDQILTGKFTIEQAQIRNLITDKIAGVAVSDFVRTDKDTTIVVPVTFAQDIKVNDEVFVEGTLNEYKIEELADDIKVLKGNREFHAITVDGNLSWKNSHKEFERLSHLFENAVTVDTPQTLTHRVTFDNGLQAIAIKSEKGINDIDYPAIVEDAVDVNDKKLEMLGRITFVNEVEVSHGQLNVEKLQTEEVDGIDLALLDEQVVRKGTKVLIRGTKTFERGLKVKRVFVTGEIDGIFPNDLVTINETRLINTLTLKEVRINGDLDFDRLEGIDLESLLNDRVTNDGDHTVRGDMVFEDDLHVENCKVKSINGIELADVLVASSDSGTPQKITGSKIFTDFVVETPLEDTSINGISFDEIDTRILRRDRDETIRRPVIFVDTIRVLDSIHVDEHVNDHDIEVLHTTFKEVLNNITETVRIEQPKIDTALALIRKLETNLDKMPGWFDFLEFGQKLSPSSRVEHAIAITHQSESKDSVLRLFLHEFTEGGKCGLPTNCAARSVQAFDVDHGSLQAKKIGGKDCAGVFQITSSSSGATYHIVNEVTSVNTTCINPGESGVTTVHFITEDASSLNLNNIGKDVPTLTLKTGFIEDVKGFSTRGGHDYWIIAQYFDAASQSHNAPTLVYEVVEDDLKLVQEIDSQGAKRLSIDFVDKKWILGIVNTEPDTHAHGPGGSSSCHIHSAIYSWDEGTKSFMLIRTVETKGPVDIASTTVVTGVGEFAENFITFAETRDTDVENEQIGKVSIYRYERDLLSYSLYQVIDSVQTVKSLSTLTTKEFAYLATVSDDGLKFYKFLHAEGFRQDLTVPFKGALDANGIVWKNQIVFPIVGSKSILAKGKFSGKITSLA